MCNLLANKESLALSKTDLATAKENLEITKEIALIKAEENKIFKDNLNLNNALDEEKIILASNLKRLKLAEEAVYEEEKEKTALACYEIQKTLAENKLEQKRKEIELTLAIKKEEFLLEKEKQEIYSKAS